MEQQLTTESAKHNYFLIGLIVLLIILIVGSGIYFWQKCSFNIALQKQIHLARKEKEESQQKIAELQNQIVRLKAEQETLMSKEKVTITQKLVWWKGERYNFIHHCLGTVKQGQVMGSLFNPVSYCLGENILVLVTPDGQTLRIHKTDISEPRKAPILMKTELIASTTRTAIVLISYSPEPCSTVNDCGVGMPTNYVTIAFNLIDNTCCDIKNFPKWGTAAWNPSGTKSVFIPKTCGGVGCHKRALIGYKLSMDEATDALTEEIASGERGVGISGEPVPYWANLHWINNSQVSATIISPDGSKKEVKVIF